MDHYLNIADDVEGLRLELEEKGEDLFEAKASRPQLLVSRLSTVSVGEKSDIYAVAEPRSVDNVTQLHKLSNALNDVCQIFTVQQSRSWSSLDISSGLMQSFFDVYNVFSAFSKCILTFGRREEEAELRFPSFATRPLVDDIIAYRCIGTESSYILRRAEVHGRDLIEGQPPWSIRQTAVYHRYNWDANPVGVARSVFLLVAPSAWVEKQLLQCMDIGAEYVHAVSPFSVQSILVADSLKGWMRYMSWLEGELSKQSIRMEFTRPGSRDLNNLEISVEDSQALKVLEDSVTDLQVILPTLLSTVKGIQHECQLCCQMGCSNMGITGDCDRLSKQFDQYIRALETCVQRAAVLRNKATSCAKLLSDLLSYENAINLKRISEENQLETSAMTKLTETSMKDAAAVKVLTIIGLIYLPTTIVENFFSTQFVQTNEQGFMHVSANTWLLAAIAIPLTVFTLAIWWFWAHGSISRILNSVRPFRSRDRLPDLEEGKLSRQAMQAQSMFSRVEPGRICHSRVASSMTAVSCGKCTKA